MALLDEWCLAHRLKTCSERRKELRAEAERAERSRRYRAMLRAKMMRRLLGIHQHVLNIDRLDARQNARRRDKRAVERAVERTIARAS
ncbi:MAG: hypothetical protein LUO93_06125 [Methanomicrobiales archaeon]|nr:hypothetical protein [Methanomicrobiales archaeon]